MINMPTSLLQHAVRVGHIVTLTVHKNPPFPTTKVIAMDDEAFELEFVVSHGRLTVYYAMVSRCYNHTTKRAWALPKIPTTNATPRKKTGSSMPPSSRPATRVSESDWAQFFSAQARYESRIGFEYTLDALLDAFSAWRKAPSWEGQYRVLVLLFECHRLNPKFCAEISFANAEVTYA